MNFFVLNDDVKSIIAKHLQNDCKIRTMLSSNIMIFKKYYLERLCLIMIFTKRANWSDDKFCMVIQNSDMYPPPHMTCILLLI